MGTQLAEELAETSVQVLTYGLEAGMVRGGITICPEVVAWFPDRKQCKSQLAVPCAHCREIPPRPFRTVTI